MASLSIPFPEGSKVILLRGQRITLGRFADNTIQIQDRTVSAYHFELHLEGDHYRLHDSGSTNGVVVNGRRVQDFHLREECQILIGTVLCEFHPANPMNARPEIVELLPVREEVEAVRQENHHLKTRVAILGEQVLTMEKGRGQGAAQRVDEIAIAHAALQIQSSGQADEIERLSARVAILRRDRDNLQRAYEDAHAALAIAQADAKRGIVVAGPARDPMPAVSPDETLGRPTIPLLRRPAEAPRPSDTGTQKLKP